MITNLIATVVITLVTNVSTTDNAVYEWNLIPTGPSASPLTGTVQNPPSGITSTHAIHYEPRKERGRLITPATQKTETTTVKEITTLEFIWNGEKRVLPGGERIVSQIAVTYKREEKWTATGSSGDNFRSPYITNIGILKFHAEEGRHLIAISNTFTSK